MINSDGLIRGEVILDGGGGDYSVTEKSLFNQITQDLK